jgi:hypothetical protein
MRHFILYEKIIKLAAMAAVIAFSLAACGGNDPLGNQTPVAADYDIDNLEQTYGNAIKKVTIMPKEGKSTGARIIYYNGFSALPTTVGTYPVTFDVAEASGWNSAIGLNAGTLTIRAAMAWTAVANSTFGTDKINSVAWGGGKWVAVGNNGKIAYSADGKNWTAAVNTTFGADNINCVAWGGGKFMAGGEGGKMASSADGENWTTVASNSFGTEAINGLAWGANKWVAVGHFRLAYSNADGTSWTGSDSNVPFNYQQGSPNLLSVAFGNSTFVLVGAAGGQGHGGSLAYSADGITWTACTMEALVGVAITSVCFGNSKFVAVSQDKVIYSTGGDIWMSGQGSSLSGKQLNSVAAGNGKFAAVGTNDSIFLSPDGTSWTALAGVSLGGNFYALAYEGGTWVAAGLNGAIAYCDEQ